MDYDSPYSTIDGQPQERSRKDHPYSYSRYCIYKNGWKKTDQVVWSDRLWNCSHYKELKEKILGIGDYFSKFPPNKIETFLSELFGHPIKLTGIEEECNFSSGYPYWILYFRNVN